MSRRRPLKDDLRALPRPVWILFGGSFVNRFGSFVITFLVLYMTESGYSGAQAGLAAGAYGLGALAASAAGGVLADRWGRRRTIAASMFGSAIAMLTLSQVDGIVTIACVSAIAGLMAELYRPASSALFADLVPEERRVVGFAAYRLAINAGFAIGPAVAGLMAERSFFLLFLGDAITSTIFGILSLVTLPESVRVTRDESRGGFREAWRDKPLRRVLIASVIAGVIYFQFSTTLALHVRDAGLSRTAYGVLLSLNGLLIVLLELPIASYTAVVQARRAMALGMALLALGAGLTAFAHSIVPLALTVIVWTFGEMTSAPVTGAYVTTIAPSRLRGRYSGMYSFTWGFAFIVAPTLGTPLYGVSPGSLWGACALLGLVGAGICMTLPERRVPADPALIESGPEVRGADRPGP